MIKSEHLLAPRINYTAIIPGHSLAIIPVSRTETQSFLLDKNNEVIGTSWITNHRLWRRSQQELACRALNTECDRLWLSSEYLVIPGVSHFGHIVGDMLDRIIYAVRDPELNNRKILIPNCPQAIQEILGIIGIHERVTFIDIRRPTIVTFADGIASCDHRNDNNPSANAFRAHMEATSILVEARIKKASPMPIIESIKRRNVLMITNSRVHDVDRLVEYASDHGWLIVNPMNRTAMDVLQHAYYAKKLISENGSILMNCFIGRHKAYNVLASRRAIRSKTSSHMLGGGIYNRFHEGCIHYVECSCVKESPKHAYADQIIALNEEVKRKLQG